MSAVPLRAAIVGCGLIGQRRAQTMTGATLVACADVDLKRANALAESVAGCSAFGDFTVVEGFAGTFFWDMPVDDNGFMLLRTATGKTAFLHASCTEWKNMFSFEIYGRVGKIHITGLGGSYGVERLAFHRMLPQMGPPETTNWEYPMVDDSWTVEFA